MARPYGKLINAQKDADFNGNSKAKVNFEGRKIHDKPIPNRYGLPEFYNITSPRHTIGDNCYWYGKIPGAI